MMRFVWWLLVVPIGVIVVALAVANRRSVLFSLDPFRPDNPALGLNLPLFVVIFAALLVGLLIGGAAVWWTQGRYRKACRVAQGEAKRWQSEAQRNQDQLKAAGLVSSLPTGLASPPPRRVA
jgi:uncharacterized integral membrane protein